MENILLSNYFVVKISDFFTVLIINKKNEVNNNNNKISNKINVITNSNKSTAINSNISKNSVKLKSSTYSCMGSEYYYENPLILDYNDLFKIDSFGIGTIMYNIYIYIYILNIYII